MFKVPKEQEIDSLLLSRFIDKHKEEIRSRYKDLKDAYESDHEILHMPAKPRYKPDNRIVVNFPKYIADTMNGFFIGNPIKITTDSPKVSEYIEYLDKYNSQDDSNAELSKIASIFGKAFEMYYTDEDGQLCTVHLSPMDAFMIYDDGIVERPKAFVRLYTDLEGIEKGSISDADTIRYFQTTGSFRWIGEEENHLFDGVPANEFVENEERQGIFEPVMSMVNAYNKALSEKANDVDYFADAYLKILGTLVEDEDIRFIRDSRVINFDGEDAQKLVVEFMDKPNNDTAQENLLNRLETWIFAISMVANISDENFGTASGIALLFKLQAMMNLAKTKARKFEKGLNRRYKLLFSHPASKVPADSWLGLSYQFTPNIPKNLLEEAQIAAQLDGIVSKETQLKALSVVDNVQTELSKIDDENKKLQQSAAEMLTFGEDDHEQP